MTAAFVPEAVLGALGLTFGAASLAVPRPLFGGKAYQAFAALLLALSAAVNL